jgi:hypothetical protein
MKTVDFDAWLRAAKPGDSVVYHRGSCWSVAWARTADGERTNSQQHLIEVADRAIELQQSGAHLMQRKTLKEVPECNRTLMIEYEYLAVRSSKVVPAKVAEPLIAAA